MKTIIVALLALLISGVVCGQTVDSLIEINPFGINKYPKGFKVRYNSTIKIKINNINPFMGKGYVDVANSNNDFNDLKNTIDALKGNLEDLKAEMYLGESEKGNFPPKAPIDKNFPYYYNDFFAAYSNLTNLLLLKEQQANYVNSILIIKDTASFKSQVIQFTEPIKNIKSYYLELEDKYSFLRDANGTTKEYYAKEWKDAQSKKEKVYCEEFVKNINDVKQYLEQRSDFVQNASFFYLDDARQIRDDKVVITPKIYDKTGEKVLHTFPDFTIIPTNKLRVNFSAGYLLSFIGNEEYGIRYENDAVIGVTKLEDENFSHALGGLTHAFYDFGTALDYGISAGISLNAETKLNFYGGLSIAFMQENRLVLTSGVSFVNMKRINPSNLDNDLNFTSSSVEIKYIERYKPAFFIGLTYNLKK
ncbi:hypothetical protein [Sphingobacterium sp. xlx-130]|uniref:hypothetical protein n=1 Tax=Sphingobacterium sp. xlx-130 TaxID=2654323 RepID=UPI0013D98F28|nr:hypothetical protein [Sphingobacterium sp. xlx-130]